MYPIINSHLTVTIKIRKYLTFSLRIFHTKKIKKGKVVCCIVILIDLRSNPSRMSTRHLRLDNALHTPKMGPPKVIIWRDMVITYALQIVSTGTM